MLPTDVFCPRQGMSLETWPIRVTVCLNCCLLQGATGPPEPERLDPEGVLNDYWLRLILSWCLIGVFPFILFLWLLLCYGYFMVCMLWINNVMSSCSASCVVFLKDVVSCSRFYFWFFFVLCRVHHFTNRLDCLIHAQWNKNSSFWVTEMFIGRYLNLRDKQRILRNKLGFSGNPWIV